MDPSDPRVFGYIYNTTDGRHQFWAIKTEGFAQSVVLALRDLFEDVYKQMNNSEEDNAQSDQVTTTHALLNEKTGTPQVKRSKLEDYFEQIFFSFRNHRSIRQLNRQKYVDDFMIDLLNVYRLVDTSF
jgi:hypothetical protein